MEILLVTIFILGYLGIAFEHTFKIDKLIPALAMMAILWALIAVNHLEVFEIISGQGKVAHHVEPVLLHHLGKTAEILFFLMGAMTIVEIIDYFDGFSTIKSFIKAKSKVKLLWLFTALAFVLSAIIDNLTATIVLITILQKIIKNERVHEIKSIEALYRRLENDRLLYAYFHPILDKEPLIFVQVAFTKGIGNSIQAITEGDISNADDYDAVTFYSISNSNKGLQGITLGNFLIKRVVFEIQQEFPKVKNFFTLSPIPGLATWFANQSDDKIKKILKIGSEKANIESQKTIKEVHKIIGLSLN